MKQQAIKHFNPVKLPMSVFNVDHSVDVAIGYSRLIILCLASRCAVAVGVGTSMSAADCTHSLHMVKTNGNPKLTNEGMQGYDANMNNAI